LQNFIESSPYKPAYNGGLLDIIGGIRETLTSQVVSNILSYKDDNGYKLLESFVHKFINTEIDVVQPVIRAAKENLDIAIKDKNYAIIIENKLKNAPFQRNQLARYIAKLKEKYDEKDIFLVIMPQYIDTFIRKSAGRLPLDWEYTKNEDRRCREGRYECWCDFPEMILDNEQISWCSKCDKNILERLNKNIVKLHNDFSEWLIEEAELLPQKQWPLKSCMMQFAYYLKGLYNTRFSNKLNMAITEFLRERVLPEGSPIDKWNAIDETISELDQLRNSIDGLRREVAISFIKEWENEIKKEFPNVVSYIDKNGEYSFGLLFNDIWIGCWAGVTDNNNRPYWGFYSSDEDKDQIKMEEQINMIKSILAQCNMDYEVKREEPFKVWGDTFEGDMICKNLYRAALSLGYK
ncbi:MAG: PD-(D/E)XK nuclease family protein, partial [Duncaniella sp.]|nr:PD-(D/E)XK nuclease family protein [Duncaniella sp.]